jgi:hypothetical protein
MSRASGYGVTAFYSYTVTLTRTRLLAFTPRYPVTIVHGFGEHQGTDVEAIAVLGFPIGIIRDSLMVEQP